MRRLPRIGIALAGWLFAWPVLLGGCGGVVASRHLTTASSVNDPSPATAYYFLPMVKVRLIAERKSAAGERKISRERESKAATTETTEGEKTTRKSTTTTSETSKTTTAGIATGRACTLTLQETLTEPDPRYLFTLSHLGDIFADDQVTITLAANGLLAKVETTSEGKAGQVVVKVAELAKEVMKASTGLPTGVKALDRKQGPFRYEAILDPTDAGAVEALNRDLDTRGCNLVVDVRPPAFPPAGDALTPTPASGEARDGIYYRPALPYVISFRTREESDATESVRTAQTIYLPNAAPVLAFDIARPAFVKFTQMVEFENGMLKSSKITRPSEAVGFVSIPVELAKSIVAIPSELFKFRVETTKSEAGVLEAQQKLLEAERQPLETQEGLWQALEEAREREAAPAQP